MFSLAESAIYTEPAAALKLEASEGDGHTPTDLVA